MSIYIIRHGEAAGNREGRFLGQVDPYLTEDGRVQAAALAEMFKWRDVKSIISSDLKRAEETAHIIARELAAPVETNTDLREANHGIIDGWLADEVSDSPFGKERERDKYNYRPPNGESYHDIEERVLRAIARILITPSLIVTHTGPMRIILHKLGSYSQAAAADVKIGHFDVIVLSKYKDILTAKLDLGFGGALPRE